ncbi:MAG: Rieske (2Fe-2S) protein [Alphaproteobacteria bacterium]|nr:Rieske (2Fe-2S) protein [Alphaproteobacteria bacterium]
MNGCRCCDCRRFERRDVMIGGAAFAAATMTGVLADDADAAQRPPERQFVQAGDRFQAVTGAINKQLVRPEMLELGARPVEAFPLDPASGVLRRRNRLNRLLLLRLDTAAMSKKTRERSVEGVLAYSALCTHRACTIKSWIPDKQFLRCHCHLSQFAALETGRIKRGPARRGLPMVPLNLDADGFVVATDGFTGRPGPAKK